MEVKDLYPDRICAMCGETKGWLHFAPLNPYAKTWNLTCFRCRTITPRDPFPETTAFAICRTCEKEKLLPHFFGEVEGGPGITLDCHGCRNKARRDARKVDGGQAG